jgi:hypothetical protein
MSFSEQQNQQKRIEEIEAEIEHEFSAQETNTESTPVTSTSWGSMLAPIQEWFQSLPTIGKAIVAFGSVMLGLSLLKTVFNLVSALISLTVVGVIIYLIYKFFIQSKSKS